MTNNPKLTAWLLAAVLVGSFLLCLASLNPDRFGKYHDDTIFVTTAKSLATGQGYRIISIPHEPVQIKYPPLYPFLLSLIWRLRPRFPDNITAMMLLSIVATVSFLGLAWLYIVKEKYASAWQGLLVAAFAAANWRILISGTTIYSEMVYASLSVAGLWLAEVYAKESKSRLIGLALGVFMGLAFLTRTSGIILLIAVACYYFLRKPVRRSSLPIVVGGLFVLGWISWCYAHSPTTLNQGHAYYTSTSYIHDLKAVIAEEQAASNSSALMAFSSVVATNLFMLILMTAPMVCLGIDYNWIQNSGGNLFLIKFGAIVFAFILLAKGFVTHGSAKLRLLHLYVILYLGLHLLWPYSSYDRFLMPLLPFLLLFFLAELKALILLAKQNLASGKQAAARISATFVGLIVLALFSITLQNYGSGISRSLASASLTKIATPDLQDAQAIEWINTNTDASDVLVCYRDSLYYLYTGRKAARSFLGRARASTEPPDAVIGEQAKLVLRIINENNGRYLIVTSADNDLPDPHRKSLEALVERYPQMFVPVFESTDGQSTIYRIHSETG